MLSMASLLMMLRILGHPPPIEGPAMEAVLVLEVVEVTWRNDYYGGAYPWLGLTAR